MFNAIEQYGKIELRLCKIVEKSFYRRFFSIKGIYTKEMSFEYGVFVLYFVRSEENSYLYTEKSLVLYDCFFSNI